MWEVCVGVYVGGIFVVEFEVGGDEVFCGGVLYCLVVFDGVGEGDECDVWIGDYVCCLFVVEVYVLEYICG